MDVVELTLRLHLLRFAVGQAYLWQDPDALTLVDTGLPGSAPAVAEAIRALGRDPGEVRQVVLTHCHVDHAGSAAEVRTWGEVSVLAHAADAAVIRGDAPTAEPVLPDWQRPLFEQVTPKVGLTGPPSPVDREVADGDVLDFGGGAPVLAVPGHTAGSIALHLPEHGVLFTGDTITAHQGSPILGVFNVDHAATVESFTGRPRWRWRSPASGTPTRCAATYPSCERAPRQSPTECDPLVPTDRGVGYHSTNPTRLHDLVATSSLLGRIWW